MWFKVNCILGVDISLPLSKALSIGKGRYSLGGFRSLLDTKAKPDLFYSHCKRVLQGRTDFPTCLTTRHIICHINTVLE